MGDERKKKEPLKERLCNRLKIKEMRVWGSCVATLKMQPLEKCNFVYYGQG